MFKDLFNLLISKGAKPECTYSKFGSSLIPAPYYQCFDCFSAPGHAICPQCALLCHANHNIKLVEDYLNIDGNILDGYYCDCGEGGVHKSRPCQILKQ